MAPPRFGGAVAPCRQPFTCQAIHSTCCMSSPGTRQDACLLHLSPYLQDPDKGVGSMTGFANGGRCAVKSPENSGLQRYRVEGDGPFACQSVLVDQDMQLQSEVGRQHTSCICSCRCLWRASSANCHDTRMSMRCSNLLACQQAFVRASADELADPAHPQQRLENEYQDGR